MEEHIPWPRQLWDFYFVVYYCLRAFWFLSSKIYCLYPVKCFILEWQARRQLHLVMNQFFFCVYLQKQSGFASLVLKVHLTQVLFLIQILVTQCMKSHETQIHGKLHETRDLRPCWAARPRVKSPPTSAHFATQAASSWLVFGLYSVSVTGVL